MILNVLLPMQMLSGLAMWAAQHGPRPLPPSAACPRWRRSTPSGPGCLPRSWRPTLPDHDRPDAAGDDPRHDRRVGRYRDRARGDRRMSLTTAPPTPSRTPAEPSAGVPATRTAGYANPYLCGACLGVCCSWPTCSPATAWVRRAASPHGRRGGRHGRAAGRRTARRARRGPRPPARVTLDNWVVWSIVGSVIGAALSGALAGRLRPEIVKGPRLGAAAARDRPDRRRVHG